MNKLIEISIHNLDLAWKDAVGYLEKSLKLTPEYTILDVYRMLKNGELTLWMFYNSDTRRSFGAMVTEISCHPQMKVLVIFLMAADDFSLVEPLFADLRAYGVRMGVNYIECYGRFGLEKLLKNLGFKKSYIAMRVDVN